MKIKYKCSECSGRTCRYSENPDSDMASRVCVKLPGPSKCPFGGKAKWTRVEK